VSSLSLRDYLAAFRRRRWLFIAAIVLCVAAALAYSYTRTPFYRSTVTLTYVKQNDLLTSMGTASYISGYDIDREIKTAAAVIPGRDMADRAATVLGLASWRDIPGSVSAQGLIDANVLTITAVSTSPTDAATVANGYATAFTGWRKELVRKQITDAEALFVQKLKQFSTAAARRNDPATYYSLSGQLSALRAAEALTNGNFQVVEQATAASAPFSPNHVRDGVLGLAMGLVLGIVLVLIAEQLDVRVRDQSEIAERLSMPVIGRLPVLPHAVTSTDQLAVLVDPHGGLAEAFRMLRGNLEFVGVDRNIRSLLVTSCLQGEGKTSTVCNLAVTLARAGKNVVVIEADLRRPKVHKYLGLANQVGVSNVVSGQVTIDAAVQEATIDATVPEPDGNGRGPSSASGSGGRLRVLTAGVLPPNPGEIVASAAVGTLIAEFSQHADYVLVDSPPFLAVGDATALAAKVDGVVVVMKMGDVTRGLLRDTVDFLEPLTCHKLGVVITNHVAERGGYGYRHYHYYGERSETPTPVKAG
jgi:Mrp family chromosome partitioning ATPase/capsular polysaccharide biosynthesis protein